jgi:acetoin utilization deacetylase AcuC-like enzyme
VLYISLHRFDNGKFFPHVSQSSSQHCGAAEGVGFNINICWNLPENKANSSYDRSESVGDEEYASAFQRIVMPVLQSYDCDLLLISCGFDSGDGDVIGNLKLSQAGYKLMTQSLKMLGKPMIAVLEGGYNGDVLSWGSQAVVNGLIEGEDESLNGLKYAKANSIGEEGISKCLQEIGKYWNLN